MKDNTCAIFVPLSYHHGYLPPSKAYLTYLRQKIALEIEQHCRENPINKYVLNLYGFPSLDTADFLIQLRQKYPHLFLEFVQDTTNRYISHATYQQKHNLLLAQADKKVLLSDTSTLFCQKYIIQHQCPAYYTHPYITAKFIFILGTSRFLNKIAYLAQHDNKIVSTVPLQP